MWQDGEPLGMPPSGELAETAETAMPAMTGLSGPDIIAQMRGMLSRFGGWVGQLRDVIVGQGSRIAITFPAPPEA